MKLVASTALALALTAPQAIAEDLAPDAWVSEASCADVLHRIKNPMDKTGVSSPMSALAYVGAIFGYIEGYRAARDLAMAPDEFKKDVLGRCVDLPEVPFKVSLEQAASDAA
ncbi:hypothetical protein GTA62_13150 [Roseobacter sp. HKCCD9010]|uniref:hypothetical protein n=1 Tax=unclassified Roseobacter TaxID=196798 RepID=UPI0014925229|nr:MULTISPECIES: hypothetical protein [unclassified Roseobacter]MBF9049869.1 hypothetical protein [Rhodobacterales bacterium HKCCD4356]NNV13592.1 hypothetical protein [Roseobacter sp. HKCCD7357]NNV16426.1 hypothetical protein [Roseobacter sp. HKCCD8768]NNV25885.1 hypothetical protein [Roseobacter sp. HKCCD8192]NNV30143.1 hypothetical protein [Roseobacter sp. HKCCD9061]